MRSRFYFAAIIAFVLVGAAATNINAQHQHDSSQCPMHKKQMAEMNKRGDQGMGFSQEKTTHQFRLARDGGSIEVSAKAANDQESRQQIREHLKHIATVFAAGDFDIPMFVHDQVPIGVPVMQRLKADITYKYEETETGGRVRITSNNTEAVAAIQEFLKYQIKEHQTGDSLGTGTH